MTPFKIKKIHAREVLDSRGFPTIEADLWLESGAQASAIVPSGASTGEGEALELRDGDSARFLGKGVLKAVANVNTVIAHKIQGQTFETQRQFDDALNALDGTANKSKLGANSILSVSMAFCRARAFQNGESVYETIAKDFKSKGVTLPVPLMNIINGGKHADNGLAVQEFMIAPVGFTSFKEALRAGTEVFHHLKKHLNKAGLSTGVGDEGGFAPVISGDKAHEQVMNLIMKAIEAAGYKPGKDIYLALDAASSEFSPEKGFYSFEGQKLSSSQMVDLYSQWVSKYPIISIEDGLAEHDWEGWKTLTQALGGKCQLVGDDLFVTNPIFLKKGIESKTANSILIKLNQIGTVTETLDAMTMAKENHYTQISSHRSGESEDTFIADLAVGTDCGQIKTGSASRTDRLAKYNQLLSIEEKLGSQAQFAGKQAFH